MNNNSKRNGLKRMLEHAKRTDVSSIVNWIGPIARICERHWASEPRPLRLYSDLTECGSYLYYVELFEPDSTESYRTKYLYEFVPPDIDSHPSERCTESHADVESVQSFIIECLEHWLERELAIWRGPDPNDHRIFWWDGIPYVFTDDEAELLAFLFREERTVSFQDIAVDVYGEHDRPADTTRKAVVRLMESIKKKSAPFAVVRGRQKATFRGGQT